MLKYILLDNLLFVGGTGDVAMEEYRCVQSIDHLAILNALYLRRHPNTPRMRETDVRLENPPRSTESLCNIGKLLEDKVADIESWVAWRLAELRVQGKKAEPYLIKKEGRYSLAIQLRAENEEPAGFEVFFNDGRIEYRESL